MISSIMGKEKEKVILLIQIKDWILFLIYYNLLIIYYNNTNFFFILLIYQLALYK